MNASTWDGNDPGNGNRDLGTPVLAAASGRVVYVNTKSWGGVVIQHLYKGETFYTQYGHVQNPTVIEGQDILKGEQIAEIGKVGTKTAHLHFEVRTASHPNPKYGAFWQVCNPTSSPVYLALQNLQNVTSWDVDPLLFVPSHQAYVSNQPPVAGFSMTDSSQLVLNGDTLNAIADPNTGEARITFADQSTDPDGYQDITSWDWKVNTQTASLCTGTSTCVWGFQPGGPYVVTLTIKDSAGHTAQASGTINVAAVAAVVPSLFYTLIPNPGVAGTPSVAGLAVDSQGRLLVAEEFTSVSCSFGDCGNRLLSVSPTGVLNWDAPRDATSGFAPTYFSSDSTAPNRLNIGSNDRAYMQAADGWLFGVTSAGSAISSSPWSLPLVNGQFLGFAHRTPVIVDPTDGSVYMKDGVSVSFTGFPSAVGAFTPDGTPKWPAVTFTGGGRNWGLTFGPNGNVFTIIGDSPTLVGIDRSTGQLGCQAPVTSYFDVLVGGAAGVFTSFGNTMTRFDGGCNGTALFQTERDELVLEEYFDNGVVVAIDDFVANSVTSVRVLGISSDGIPLWRNAEIVPDVLGGQNPVAARRGPVAYLLGTDLSDGKHKLFAVDSATGAIRFRLETTGMCDRCAATVAPDGTLYIGDLGGANIFVFRP